MPITTNQGSVENRTSPGKFTLLPLAAGQVPLDLQTLGTQLCATVQAEKQSLIAPVLTTLDAVPAGASFPVMPVDPLKNRLYADSVVRATVVFPADGKITIKYSPSADVAVAVVHLDSAQDYRKRTSLCNEWSSETVSGKGGDVILVWVKGLAQGVNLDIPVEFNFEPQVDA